ncbi:hypothetical protein ABH944_008320 [Caballeronia udeis]
MRRSRNKRKPGLQPSRSLRRNQGVGHGEGGARGRRILRAKIRLLRRPLIDVHGYCAIQCEAGHWSRVERRATSGEPDSVAASQLPQGHACRFFWLMSAVGSACCAPPRDGAYVYTVLSYLNTPWPVLRPSLPAATISRSNKQARYFESPKSFRNTSITDRHTSRPIRSASASGPIG